MTKPVIVTRASKGAPLTAAEMDANFNNINDAVITVTGDTGSITNSLNESFQISGGVATTSKVINDSLIIDLDDTAVTPGSYTAADITVDAQGRITSASNGSASVTPAGSNTQLQYNNSGALGASSNLTFDGSALSAPYLASSNSTGDEGGEIKLAKPQTGTTLSGAGVNIDVYQNKLRIWEDGGSNRGAYIDLTAAGASVGTNLISGGGGISDVVADTTPQLGGNLDVQANIITTSTTNGAIKLAPNGSGYIVLGNGSTMPWITSNGATSIALMTNNGVNSGSIQLNAGANGNIAIAPHGTGKSVVTGLNYNEGAIYNIGTTGGTISPNIDNGNVQKITLNSALTINGFLSPTAGQSLTLIIYGGTAYTSITSTMKFAGGIKTLTATAGCIDILSVYYDGTTYFASLGKGFA